jgi:di/tricarboxylate transporter
VTPEIATVLAILALAIILFVSERIGVDVVALIVLVGLALTGLITPRRGTVWLCQPRRGALGLALREPGSLI